jgi:hypothetical protein
METVTITLMTFNFVYSYVVFSPSVRGYLQFLVDSRAVYQALEDAVGTHASLYSLQATGLYLNFLIAVIKYTTAGSDL